MRALRDRQTVVLEHAARRAERAARHQSAAARIAAGAGPAASRSARDRRLSPKRSLRAQRPLILGGRGAVISDAEPALLALADRVGALLATSVCGHGLFSGNPWSLGISGGFSSPVADELIAESDFILGFGASFTQWTTKSGKLIAPGAVVAQVDIEAPKLGYQMPIQHAVHGDARATAEALLVELDRRGLKSAKPGRRSDAMRERIRAGDNHHFPHPDEFERAIHRSAHVEQSGRRASCRRIAWWPRTPGTSAAGCRAICACRMRAPRV